MPKCRICQCDFYYQSYTDPGESCACGEVYNYPLTLDYVSPKEFTRLKWLQIRHRISDWLVWLAGRIIGA